MKKLISGFLAALMVLSLFIPLTAVAADGDSFRIESTQATYATLKEAVDAAVEGDTITMLKDYNINTEARAGFYVDKAITIDGNNLSMVNDDGWNPYCWYFSAPEGKTVTVKNLNLTAKQGFRISATGQSIVFNNVKATITYGLFSNLQHYGGTSSANTTTVNFINSTINHNGITPALCTYGKFAFEVNLQNSSIIKGLDAAINTTNSADMSYSTVCNNSGTLTLNLDGASVITAARVLAEGRTITCFSNDSSNAGALTVNLADGAELRLTDVNGNSCKFFANFRDSYAPVVNDNGAKWIVSKEVAQKGVALPTGVSFGTDETVLGWSVGSAMIQSENYQDEEATADVTFSATTFKKSDFQLKAGASVRTTDPYGLRFTLEVDDAFYQELKAIDANVEVGIVLALSSKVFGSFMVSEMMERDIQKIVMSEWHSENEGGTDVFHAAMYYIPETATGFQTKISAIAYFTVHFADGTSKTIYTEYNAEDHSRSLYEVAKAYCDSDAAENEMLRNVVSVVDGN